MRALSIRQPYAEQISRGTKRFEYRSRPTAIRGRIYIYASLKPGKAEEFERMHIQPGDLPTGVLVGTVEITDCSGEPGDYRWAFSATAAIAASSSTYEALAAGLVQSVLASLLTTYFALICSFEHETGSSLKTLASPNAPTATQATRAGPATGTEFMAEAPLKPLKAILKTIREQADYALKQLQDTEEQRSMRWKCKECGYIKHFIRPASFEATGRCPRCKGTSFEVVAR
jgi:rubrerythrin